MKRKRFILSVLTLLFTLFVGVLIEGTVLTAPVRQPIGEPPGDLAARMVQFQSASGAMIYGWYAPGKRLEFL